MDTLWMMCMLGDKSTEGIKMDQQNIKTQCLRWETPTGIMEKWL